ncbi:MAG: hypothetical protein IBJ03_02090 [Gemmatimonadaceae bacterium]|nr:hypothetical protein [Gemmatimonadaceae bacterium]
MRRSGLIMLAVLGSALPILAHAQSQTANTPDSTNFRAGQWGAEFALGSSLDSPAGVGVLRFSKPRRAYVLDVSGQVSRQSGDGPGKQSQSTARLRLGTRWYRPLSSRVLQSLTLGALVSSDQRDQQSTFSALQGPLVKSRTMSTGGGVFAELGGTWMVTSQLSLGAAWQGNVLYSRFSRRTVNGDSSIFGVDGRVTQWSAALGGLGLRAGLYF